MPSSLVFTAAALLPLVLAQECPAGSPPGTCTAPRLQCSTYMAPSTLGGDTNMGIYTGVDLTKDEKVKYPEIAIPLMFREWGNHREGYDDGTLWDRYVWEGPVTDIETYNNYNRDDSRAVFIPGIGCTVNSIMDMRNIDSTHGSIYDTAGLHRSKDPGSGAFCPYHSSETTVAVDHIPAGAELFAEYGDYWIPDIPGAQITLNHVMDTAEDFLQKELYPFYNSQAMSNNLQESLFKFVKDFPVNSQPLSVMPRFPWKEVAEALEKVKDVGVPEVKDGEEEDKILRSVVRQMIRKQSVQTLDWLEEFGYCQDHIRPDISTIPQAGRGAFATRDLPQGTVVGYSPLIHMGVYGREVMKIDYEDEGRSQYDLIINYSFGHRNSSLVLTPYGGMINYINHASHDKANVKLRWPDKELVAHKPDWLTRDVTFLRDTIEKIGLSFEYVATRDIKEGEEVFMDYGPEWEQAWNDFVENWTPPEDAENYVHSSLWNETFVRTMQELEANPYPSNLIIMCELSFGGDGEGNYHWLPVLRSDPSRTYCQVLERKQDGDDFIYKVEMQLDEEKDEWITVSDVPGENVYLYDDAYTNDWHLQGFRHPIAIPDELMPELWQNGPPQDPF